MKRDNVGKGRVGEEAAEKYLIKKGYRVVERNFRTRFGEVDLIVTKDGRVVFVEVKAKTSDRFGEPWEMVDKRKLERVKMMGKYYLAKKGLGETACRIDVVGVWLGWQGEVEKVEHWEDAES